MFLDEAIEAAARAVKLRMELLPAGCLERIADDAGSPTAFAGAVARGGGPARVIAEIKRMSPSAGTIRSRASVAEIAPAYEAGGAAAVSVLTSGYRFGGCMADLEDARSACALPLLRKDFISGEYQVLEARAFGASAVLLISEALTETRLETLLGYARELDMEALVEAHTREGIEKALAAGAALVGINNRDLATLTVDVATTERLLSLVPDGTVVVSESGIRTAECARRVADFGVDALLIGEELMRASEPGQRLREFVEALGQVAVGGEGGRAGCHVERVQEGDTGSECGVSKEEVCGSCG